MATTSDRLAGLGYQQLYEALNQAQDEKAVIDHLIASLNAEIVSRLEPSLRSTLAEGGKDCGTAQVYLQDGLTAKGTIEKKIEWDSDKLLALAQTMPWDQVRKVFKIAFSVPEKIYAGVKAADEKLGAEIDKARTVKPGRTKIELIKAA